MRSALLVDKHENGKVAAKSLSLVRNPRAPRLECHGGAGGSPVSGLLEVLAMLLISLNSYKVNTEIN